MNKSKSRHVGIISLMEEQVFTIVVDQQFYPVMTLDYFNGLFFRKNFVDVIFNCRILFNYFVSDAFLDRRLELSGPRDKFVVESTERKIILLDVAKELVVKPYFLNIAF